MLVFKDFELMNHSELILSIEDLTLNSGDFYYICGKNRSGKSLLLSLINNTYHNYRGEVKYKDRNIDDRFFHEKIRLIRDTAAIFPTLSIEENILLGIKDKNQKKIIEECVPLLSKFKLGFNKNLNCSKLSSSELKIIEIIRGYIQKPYMLLIDDIDNYFDTEYFEGIYNLINQMKQNGTLIIASGKSLLQNEKQLIIKDHKLEY